MRDRIFVVRLSREEEGIMLRAADRYGLTQAGVLRMWLALEERHARERAEDLAGLEDAERSARTEAVR